MVSLYVMVNRLQDLLKLYSVLIFFLLYVGIFFLKSTDLINLLILCFYFSFFLLNEITFDFCEVSIYIIILIFILIYYKKKHYENGFCQFSKEDLCLSHVYMTYQNIQK